MFTNSPVASFNVYEKANGLPHNFIGGVIKTNMHDNAWAQLERSEITAGQFSPLFAAESAAAGHEITGDELLSLLNLSTFHEGMINALNHIQAAGFKTGCITNNMPSGSGSGWDVSDTKIGRAQAILDSFDHVIESAKAGVRKPEPRIYQMMCEALEEEPVACVFVDDLGVNLKPARALGMTTIKVPILDVAPAIAKLAQVTGLKFS